MSNHNRISDLEKMPAFLTADNLVELGLFCSRQSVYKARENGYAPPEIMIGKRSLRFPKDDLIQWLETFKMNKPRDG